MTGASCPFTPEWAPGPRFPADQGRLLCFFKGKGLDSLFSLDGHFMFPNGLWFDFFFLVDFPRNFIVSINNDCGFSLFVRNNDWLHFPKANDRLSFVPSGTMTVLFVAPEKRTCIRGSDYLFFVSSGKDSDWDFLSLRF